MNNTTKCLFLVVCLVFSIFFFTQCKKDTHIPLNVTLYNKSLDSIQYYIKGKWKLNYLQGGILGPNYIKHFNSYFWNIDKDHITTYNNGQVDTDTNILWLHEYGIYISGDSTYTINFMDNFNFWRCVIDEIKNDELIMHDNSFDPFYYNFTKSN